MIVARRLGIAVLRVALGVIQLVAIAAVVALIYAPAAILTLLIGLMILAFMAVDDAFGSAERMHRCAGASWSATSVRCGPCGSLRGQAYA